MSQNDFLHSKLSEIDNRLLRLEDKTGDIRDEIVRLRESNKWAIRLGHAIWAVIVVAISAVIELLKK